jgi:cytochrome c biogenesis factor
VEKENTTAAAPTVILNDLNADQKIVALVFTGTATAPAAAAAQSATVTDELVVEFSKKPFMSILWSGTVLLMLGTLIAFRKRVSGN